MSTREQLRRYWPLFGLELRTPRLLMTPLSDDDLGALLEVSLAGVHAPDARPFDFPWASEPPAELVVNSLKHYWTQRAQLTPARWQIQFGIHLDGQVIGVQGFGATHFAALRTVDTGSWIGLPFQGQGIGTEMRAGVLQFAFDHLGALRARSAAFVDNPPSRAVSNKLGYFPNGREWKERAPGNVAECENLLITPDTFVRPDWTVQASGLDECRALLGVAP